MGSFWWGYHEAATVGPWSITLNAQGGGELSASVQSQEPHRITQRPLWFEVPRTGTPWRWPVESLQIEGDRCTATLGPQE